MSKRSFSGPQNCGFFRVFAADEAGAVTVDWVVMTSAVVGLGIAVMVSVSGGTTGLADLVSSSVSAMEVNGSSDESGGSSVGADGTWDEYLAAYGGDSAAAAAAAGANAPDGHYFSGWIDGASGKPLYTANDQQSFMVGDQSYGFNEYWSSVANGSHPA